MTQVPRRACKMLAPAVRNKNPVIIDPVIVRSFSHNHAIVEYPIASERNYFVVCR